MDGYLELANAIIMRAVKDYRAARRKLRKKPEHECSLKRVADVEEFFLSNWFGVLTTASGRMILERLKEEFSV